MLHDAVLVGSRLFHELESRADYYDLYFRDKKTGLWESPETITLGEIERLVLFLNQWASHYENSPTQQTRLLSAVRKTFPFLEAVKDSTLQTIDLGDASVRGLISGAFQEIASCGTRYEATATSKILHTIRPELFVMWDSAIQFGYALRGTGEDYAERFLPRIQKLASRAVDEYSRAYKVPEDRAVRGLTKCGHSLAKVLDEYNYTKFTLKSDEVWDAELGS
jgi:hypothetical protein